MPELLSRTAPGEKVYHHGLYAGDGRRDVKYGSRFRQRSGGTRESLLILKQISLTLTVSAM